METQEKGRQISLLGNHSTLDIKGTPRSVSFVSVPFGGVGSALSKCDTVIPDQ